MRRLIPLAALVLSVAAQEPCPQTVSKIFEISSGSPERIAEVLSSLGVSVRVSKDVPALAVTATAEMMPAVEQIVRRLDAAPAHQKDLEIAAYIVQASRDPMPASAVPADLQPALEQVRGVLAFGGLRVLDTILVRARPGQTVTASGSLGAAPGATYDFRVRPQVIERAGRQAIRLEGLRLAIAGPMPSSLSTDLEVKEGQKVVVGKTGAANPRSALILVISCKQVE